MARVDWSRCTSVGVSTTPDQHAVTRQYLAADADDDGENQEDEARRATHAKPSAVIFKLTSNFANLSFTKAKLFYDICVLKLYVISFISFRLLYVKSMHNQLKTLQNKTIHRSSVHWQLQG